MGTGAGAGAAGADTGTGSGIRGFADGNPLLRRPADKRMASVTRPHDPGCPEGVPINISFVGAALREAADDIGNSNRCMATCGIGLRGAPIDLRYAPVSSCPVRIRIIILSLMLGPPSR